MPVQGIGGDASETASDALLPLLLADGGQAYGAAAGRLLQV